MYEYAVPPSLSHCTVSISAPRPTPSPAAAARTLPFRPSAILPKTSPFLHGILSIRRREGHAVAPDHRHLPDRRGGRRGLLRSLRQALEGVGIPADRSALRPLRPRRKRSPRKDRVSSQRDGMELGRVGGGLFSVRQGGCVSRTRRRWERPFHAGVWGESAAARCFLLGFSFTWILSLIPAIPRKGGHLGQGRFRSLRAPSTLVAASAVSRPCALFDGQQGH